jgi:hypothetical protein
METFNKIINYFTCIVQIPEHPYPDNEVKGLQIKVMAFNHLTSKNISIA